MPRYGGDNPRCRKHGKPTEAAGRMTDRRLTRYELELMDVLWQLGEGTVQDVCDRLGRDLAYTTVMTTLRLLAHKKKVLKRVKRGRAYVYRPVVTREEMGRTVLADLKDVLFGKHLPSLMLNLLEEEEFTPNDLRALKSALKQLDSKAKETR
jgi:BlaI family transcriptional regulator, penicillinase repressor